MKSGEALTHALLAGDFDWSHIQGSYDFGPNATGVIHSRLHILDDEVIFEETMPAEYVEQCFQEVARLSELAKQRRPGGYIKARIPTPIYWMWRREWERTGKQQGVLWRAFFAAKIEDRDYRKFRVHGV